MRVWSIMSGLVKTLNLSFFLAKSKQNSKLYDTKHDPFINISGFHQVRGAFSQDNVNIRVNDRVFDVGGSHGKSCLCASVVYLAATCIKRPERIDSKYLDTILMRGKKKCRYYFFKKITFHIPQAYTSTRRSASWSLS